MATLQRFASGCTTLLANRDCPVLHEHFEATSWWSTRSGEAVEFAAIPLEERGDGTLATWYEHGVSLGTLEVPLPGRHNLSNTVAAMAACRLEGVPFADLRQAVASLRPPGAASTAAASGRTGRSSTTTPTIPAKWRPPSPWPG